MQLDATVAHERGRVDARLLGGPDERPEVDPPVRRRRRKEPPADRLVVLSVVVVREVERKLLLLLRVVGGIEPDLPVVLERADRDPVADVPEPGDARAGAIEVASPSAGIRLEQAGVRADGGRRRRVERDVVQGLLDLARIAAVPLGPHLAERLVRHRSARCADFAAELGETATLAGVAPGAGGAQERERHEEQWQSEPRAQTDRRRRQARRAKQTAAGQAGQGAREKGDRRGGGDESGRDCQRRPACRQARRVYRKRMSRPAPEAGREVNV